MARGVEEVLREYSGEVLERLVTYVVVRLVARHIDRCGECREKFEEILVHAVKEVVEDGGKWQ